jgi:signal transduction histidine kinase/ketosteroid isomerase-like protein
MKLTKKIEAEILKVYHTYWDSYLKGDVEIMHPLLTDEYTQVGSAEGEVFSNKKDAVQFLYDTIDQVAGKLEMRNRKTILEQLEDAVLLHEFCDLYALANNNWIFYSKFRASTLMRQKKEGWKIIHQHSSFPDTKAEDGQNIAIDKIAAENLELRDAVKRRTIELENKNRELEIETSLEKVRAVAMGMKKPDDVLDVCKNISQQLQSLDVKEIRNVQTAIFYEEKGTYMNYEYYAKHDKTLITETVYTDHEIAKAFAAKMLKGKGEISVTLIKGEEKVREWFSYQKTTNVFIDTFLETASSLNYYWFSLGPVALGISTYVILNDIELGLFKRFLHVFELAYRRYLDIEKAMEQAKEAQIELGLERVRARTMAMQHSDELREAVLVIYEQLQQLDFASHACNIIIIDKDTLDMQFWVSGFTQEIYPESYHIPRLHQTYHEVQIAAWQQGVKYQVFEYSGKGKIDFDKIFFSKTDFKNVPEEAKKVMIELKSLKLSTAFFNYGALQVLGAEVLSNDKAKTLQRFAKVFEQTYTRFLDLQKAEAQAKEAQIETALEKVRSRSLAMHQSEELGDVVITLLQRLNELDIKPDGININILKKDSKSFDTWFAAPDYTKAICLPTPYFNHPVMNDAWDAIEAKKELYHITYTKEIKDSYFTYLYSHTSFKQMPEERKKMIMAAGIYNLSVALANNTAISVHNYSDRALSEKEHEILKRFSKVFQQCYTRFLDLQKAEAQTKEAQIETALERVRSKTMAMHNSNDVGETAAVMVDELKKLGIETIRCGIGIMHEPGDMEVWTISTDENNKTDIIIGWLDMNMHPLLHGAFESWRKKNESFSYELKDDDLLNYYNAINNYPGYPIRYDTTSLPEHIHHNEFYFPEGILFAFSLQQLTEDQRKIFKRFAGVFGQTYRRYLDLKKAEAQAREAKIESSLERMRSVAMGIRKSEEMILVAESLYKEMRGLGITNIRNTQIVIKIEGDEMYLVCVYSDDTAEVFKESRYDTSPITQQMYDELDTSKEALYQKELTGKEFEEWLNWRKSTATKIDTKLMEARSVSFCLYSIGEGHLGISAYNAITGEQLNVLKRFRNVFKLSYRRFMDVAKSEEQAMKLQQEKERLEYALNELQTTQKQLIQSEKMASLGELTAGIAHEIQNPLNFVNNFSEVNKELLAEMKEEMDKGNLADAKEIANDVIANEEKINHHGKRADAIVKGMLQHSRSSSATKESTDINKLVDEYLRLAYHGLRAKDKSFNATMKTDFDESIGNINIIPQDIGRVILNLITNAFYVVNEKALSAVTIPRANKYEPAVSVSTKKIGDKVLIAVKDNGNGIPQKVLDKIFHPFFTTKPAGQGTGLGLSLSYDIVKAHGGELKVETKVGEGSEFIVELPNS